MLPCLPSGLALLHGPDVGDLNAVTDAISIRIMANLTALPTVCPGQNYGLLLQGFYYVAMSCTDGQLEGYYFDSGCQPFQKLKLEPARISHHGFSSSAYQFS